MGRLIGRPRIKKSCGQGPRLLRKWRIEQDPAVSLAVLAEQLSYNGHRSLQGYETGLRRLPLGKLLELAKITGIPAEDLAWPDQVLELRRMTAAAKEA